jgi:hypothetical protein
MQHRCAGAQAAVMYIGGLAADRPVSGLEELELRRDRLQELITLQLVSPTLSEQIRKAIAQLNEQITSIRAERTLRLAA